MTPATHREQLIGMLSEAAEIEHCLMCTYLYGAFSLKTSTTEGLTDAELAAVRRWRGEVIGIATDEMLHLALVTNLLVSIGARPHYRRFNFPISGGLFPADVSLSLAPLDEATLDHFVYLERPADVAEQDPARYTKSNYKRRVVANRLMAFSDDYDTVGELYHTIGASFQALSVSHGEAALFIGDPDAQLKRRDFDLPGLCTITSVKDALAAIEIIVHQGEGSPLLRADSHYARFSAIRAEWQRLAHARQGFVPYRAAARDPVMRSPIDSDRVQITADPASTLLDAGNACYELMLRQLMHLSDTAHCGAHERALIRDQSLMLMHAIAVIGTHLTTLPANAERPGMMAGLTFTVSRSALGYVSHDSSCALMAERCHKLADRLTELAAHAPDLARYAAKFQAAGAAWRAARAAEPLPSASANVMAKPAPAAAPTPTVPSAIAVASAIDSARQIEVVRGAQTTIRFDAKRCIHARHCVLGEPAVFVANQPGEWIFPDAVSAERVALVAQNCPSGAIRYERHDGAENEAEPRVNVVRVRESGPLAFHAPLIHYGRAGRWLSRDALPLWPVSQQALLRRLSHGRWLYRKRRACDTQHRAPRSPRWAAQHLPA